MIGVTAGPIETVELAKKFGFAACDLSVNAVRETADAGDQSAEAAVETAREVAQRMKNLGISPGSCGGIVPGKLSVPEDEWSSAMDDLGERLRVAGALGFGRTTAVMLPFHEQLPFDQCFTLHVERLKQVAGPLADAGFRLGIEYVSQKTRRAGYPHEFLYDLDGTLRLLEAVAAPNVGVLLDSFHWFCAEETVDDVRRLASEQVVVVHVNDSIEGRSMDEQVAFERELPGATGIIDLAGLLGALRDIGYDGPITAEPMDKSLKAMADDDAVAATAAAFESIGM
jgi:sugar phosphate isomerase/epimerase